MRLFPGHLIPQCFPGIINCVANSGQKRETVKSPILSNLIDANFENDRPSVEKLLEDDPGSCAMVRTKGATDFNF